MAAHDDRNAAFLRAETELLKAIEKVASDVNTEFEKDWSEMNWNNLKFELGVLQEMAAAHQALTAAGRPV